MIVRRESASGACAELLYWPRAASPGVSEVHDISL
jgi:hypothetical protein